MTATLRHDIGLPLREAIGIWDATLLERLDGKTASRWGGVGNPRWDCYSFAIKLPKHLAEAMHLRHILHQIWDQSPPMLAGNARTLCLKMTGSLGLPLRGYEQEGEEQSFVAKLQACPDDIGGWLMYSDWLEEHGELKRAEVIRAWAHPKKAAKVKYGVMVLALPLDSRG